MGVTHLVLRCLPTPTNRTRRAALRWADHTLGPDTIRQIEQIPGCLNREQGSLLAWLAAQGPPDASVVEIGSFMGRSTVWLARGAQHAGTGRVVSIDPHLGHGRPPVHPDLDSFEAFRANIEAAALTDRVEIVRRESADVARQWQEPIRLLWIDGSHRYEDVRGDLEGFAGHVVPGGHVAMHDTRGRRFPGVRRAMLEYFSRHREFRRAVRLRNLTAYRRDA